MLRLCYAGDLLDEFYHEWSRTCDIYILLDFSKKSCDLEFWLSMYSGMI